MNVGAVAAGTLPTIYILDGSIALTGAFVCARNMARALKGIARVVLILPAKAAIAHDALDDFCEVHYLPIRPIRRDIVSILMYIPALIASSLMLRRRMWRDHAEILIINDFYHMQGVVCRLLGFSGGIYTWVRINPAAFGGTLSAVWLWAGGFASTKVIAVSKYINALLPDKIRPEVLYDSLYRIPKSAYPIEPPLRFIFVGNYIVGKGQNYAIEAFAHIATEFPDVELHFHGGDMGLAKNEAYKAALQQRIVALNLEKRVYLHGFSERPEEIMRGALAALNFSSSESFSMTILEAQGAGLPVIATLSGGPAEIIQDGVTGILVPINDVSAMETAMRSLIKDRQLAAKMGIAARERVMTKFSANAFAKKLAKILNIEK